MESTPIAKRQKAGTMYMWLAYLTFFLIDPIVMPSVRLWTLTLAVTAVFLVVYATLVRTESRTVRYCMIAATCALGAVSLPWNSGGITFLIYAASFLPFSVPNVRVVLALFAVEWAICLAEARWLHLSWINAWLGILLTGAIGGGNIFFAQQRRADCKLRMAQEEIEALAAVAERERIARDLHDVLGHTLSVITMKAELAARLLHPGPQGAAVDAAVVERAAAEIGDVERMARSSLAEVREAIGGYRARGFPAELEHARRTLQAAGVTLQVDEGQASAPMTAAEETALSLALREAVTNIVRHAGATDCHLRLTDNGGRRQLVVEDNGLHAPAVEGNGLRGMRERVEALGGRMELKRERGTRLTIELPLRTTGAAG